MELWRRITRRITRRGEAAHEHPPPQSLVLLLLRPRFLDAAMLARLATRAWGRSIRPEDIAQRRVAQRWQAFVLNCDDVQIAVHNAARRYIDADQLQTARPRNPQADQAIRDHQAWLSVDVLSDLPADKVVEAQRALGKLAAALAMSDCLAVYAPAFDAIQPYSETARSRLESDEPMSVFAVE